jgi:hypothetical protein
MIQQVSQKKNLMRWHLRMTDIFGYKSVFLTVTRLFYWIWDAISF